MTQIKTVLFDLGNVLVYIDFNVFWRSLGFFQPEEIAPFANGYASWTLQYETGHISTDDYLKRLQAVFNNRFTVAHLEQAFASIILEPVEGMINIVKRVSQARHTALVSNTNEIHYKMSLAKLDVLHILHTHYLSYQLHVMKPGHDFYDAIIKDQDVHPSEILFIDDITENIEAAKAIGMQALKFISPAQLETELKNLSVL
jgi:putative hydrolase of the HAD superfamily